jgi:LPXTG-motif cell wall-anchored protein
MFTQCDNLKRIDLSTWNTKNVTNFTEAFSECGNLESVDLSSWTMGSETSNQSRESSIFEGCEKLKSISLGELGRFSEFSGLPPIPLSDKYTGEWIGLDTGKIYSSSDDFMINYDGSVPDTYVWKKKSAYVISYNFVTDKNSSKGLPEEIMRLLPAPLREIDDKAVVESPTLSTTRVIFPEGAWTFKGWDNALVTISGADVQVTGVWEFTPKITSQSIVTETVHFVSDNGRVLMPAFSQKVMIVSLIDQASGKRIYYFKLIDHSSPSVDPYEKLDASWNTGAASFPAIAYPAVKDYHVISTTDSAGDLTQITAQNVDDKSADLEFTVTYAQNTGAVTVPTDDVPAKPIQNPSTSTDVTPQSKPVKRTLPRTGENESEAVFLAGSGMLGLGALELLLKKRQQNPNQ